MKSENKTRRDFMKKWNDKTKKIEVAYRQKWRTLSQ